MPKPPPHLRVTMRAEQAFGDIALLTLSLKPQADAGPDPDPQEWLGSMPLTGLDNHKTLIRDACQEMWSRATTHISHLVVLKRVTIAAIDDEGHYMGTPVEFAVSTEGGDANSPFPAQIATKVTLETDGDLKRVKGGFFLPGRTQSGFDWDLNLYSAGMAGEVQTSMQTFLNRIQETATGNTLHAMVVVASGGRTNPDGTVRLPPTLHDVERVSVGRRPDVQRRRANKLLEQRPTASDVD